MRCMVLWAHAEIAPIIIGATHAYTDVRKTECAPPESP